MITPRAGFGISTFGDGEFGDFRFSTGHSYGSGGVIRNTVKHRYKLDLRISRPGGWKHRYSQLGVRARRQHSYGVNQKVRWRRAHRYSAAPPHLDKILSGVYLQSSLGYSVPALSLDDLIITNPITGEPYEINPGNPQVYVKNFKADGSLFDFNEFQITMSESSPTEWSFSSSDAKSVHSPRNQLGDWTKKLYINKDLSIDLNVDKIPFVFSGLGIGYNQSRGFLQTLLALGWRGVDRSHKLFDEDITMSSIGSEVPGSITASQQAGYPVAGGTGNYYVTGNQTAGSSPGTTTGTPIQGQGRIWTAAQIIIDTLETMGVPYDISNFYEDDWVVPYFVRQKGQPISWIQSLLQKMGYEWYMKDGTTFKVYRQIGSTQERWTYDFEEDEANYSEDGTLQNIVNQVKVVRAAEGSIVDPVQAVKDGTGTVPQPVPQADGTEVLDFGEYTVNFNPPANGVNYEVVAQTVGIFSNFRFYNAAGVLIGVRDLRTPSTIPTSIFAPTTLPNPQWSNPLLNSGMINGVSRVVFTWGEQPGVGDIQGGYGKIVFTKAAAIPTATISNTAGEKSPTVENTGTKFDPGFSITVNDTESQEFYGFVRSVELIADPSIPDLAIAEKVGKRYLERLSRQFFEASYTVPLNLLMVPGDVVKEIHPELGLTRRRIITRVTHILSPNPDRMKTTYDGVEYEDIN